MRKAMLYVMQAPNGDVKVGFSNNPEQRRRSLGADVALVHTTDVIADARRVETLAHRLLVLNGKPIRGEWFEASLEAAISAVELAIQQAEGAELALGGEFVRRGLSAEIAPSRANKRSVSVWLEKEQVKDLKMAALHEEMSIQEFLELAIEAACESSAKRRKARDNA